MLQLKAADIPFVEACVSVDLLGKCLLSRRLKHGVGAIHSDDGITSLSQRDSMISCATSEIHQAMDRSISVGSKQPFNQLTLFTIVLLSIEMIIGASIFRPERFPHASTSCTASHT